MLKIIFKIKGKLRIIFCIVFLLFYALPLVGQYKIKLKSKNIEIPGRNFNIVKVLDLRENKVNVGTVRRGIYQRGQIAVIKGGVTKAFQKYIKKTYKPVENGYPVLMVVHKLNIGETFTEKATATAIYSFYLIKNEGYMFISKDDYFVNSSSIVDATSKHDNTIEKTIQLGFQDIASINWQDNIHLWPTYSLEEIKNDVNRENSYPIQKTHQYVRGIYYNIDDFRNNAPKHQNIVFKYKNNIAIPKSKFVDKVYILKDGSEVRINNMWGYCDGQDIYIKNDRGEFVKMIRKEDNFYFYTFMTLYENEPGIYGVLTGNTKDHILIKLDLVTGEFLTQKR